MNYKPERTCMGCKEKKSKNDFIRIVKNKNNEINIDFAQNQPGRGAYLCKDLQCLEKVIKTRSLERALGIKIPKEIYEKLRGVILDK